MPCRYAGFWIRAIAEWIDIAILAAFTSAIELAGLGVVFWLRHLSNREIRGFADAFDPSNLQASIGLLYLVCATIYFTAAHHRPGFTLGQRIFGLRVVKSDDGGPVSIGRSIARTLASLLSWLFFGTGFLIAAIHPKKRTLHDLLAGTAVLRA